MKFIAVLLAVGLAANSVVYAELFKWKDEHGNTIYSDQPPPGGQKEDSEIDQQELPAIITMPAPRESTSATTSSQQNNQDEAGVNYQEFSVLTPEHDSIVRENSGKVTISIRVEPNIFVERGDILVIYMDDKEIARGDQTSIMLDNVDRGTHSVKAQILNNRGEIINETDVTKFTLQRYHI